MASPWPKILIRITVPTGGWVFKWYASVVAQFDTAITCTIPAGNYYMADDQQSDCFLFALSTVAIAASKLAGVDEGPIFYIKQWDVAAASTYGLWVTALGFEGAGYSGVVAQDVRVAWTEEDGDEIGKVLGFDTSADLDLTGANNAFTVSERHHAYGWYAEDDGWLEDDPAELIDAPQVAQSVAVSGHVKTHFMGRQHLGHLALQFMTRRKTYSGGKSYGDAPIQPYKRNEGLECWWREASQGTPFRVYRSARRATAVAAERGSVTGLASSTVMTDAAKSWSVEPQRWAGRLLYSLNYGDELSSHPFSWHIASNTATALTVSNAHPLGYNFNGESDPMVYYIFDHPYETYWLDMDATKRFAPTEIPKIDHYNFRFALRKYKA